MGSCVGSVRQQYVKPSGWVIHAVFVLFTLLSSGMHVLSKPALDHVPPFVFAIFRLSFAMPFLFLTTLKEKRVELTWKDNGHLMLIGLGGVGVAQSVIFVANKLVGAGILSMMIPLSTILTVVMSGCLGMERVGPLKGFGVMLSVFGSVAIAYFSENDFHADTTWGVGFMFLQASGWSSYLILMSKFLDRKPIPMYAYFRAVLWGYLYMLPFAIYQMIQVTWSEVPYWVYLSEMYCGILVSSGAHVMMSWLIQHCSALLPASYTCLQPLSTVSLALLFLGETFNIWLIICMFSILSGLALIIFARAQEQKQAKLSKGSADEDEQEPLLPEDPANSTSDVQGNSASVAVKVVEEAA